MMNVDPVHRTVFFILDGLWCWTTWTIFIGFVNDVENFHAVLLSDEGGRADTNANSQYGSITSVASPLHRHPSERASRLGLL